MPTIDEYVKRVTQGGGTSTDYDPIKDYVNSTVYGTPRQFKPQIVEAPKDYNTLGTVAATSGAVVTEVGKVGANPIYAGGKNAKDFLGIAFDTLTGKNLKKAQHYERLIKDRAYADAEIEKRYNEMFKLFPAKNKNPDPERVAKTKKAIENDMVEEIKAEYAKLQNDTKFMEDTLSPVDDIKYGAGQLANIGAGIAGIFDSGKAKEQVDAYNKQTIADSEALSRYDKSLDEANMYQKQAVDQLVRDTNANPETVEGGRKVAEFVSPILYTIAGAGAGLPLPIAAGATTTMSEMSRGNLETAGASGIKSGLTYWAGQSAGRYLLSDKLGIGKSIASSKLSPFAKGLLNATTHSIGFNIGQGAANFVVEGGEFDLKNFVTNMALDLVMDTVPIVKDGIKVGRVKAKTIKYIGDLDTAIKGTDFTNATDTYIKDIHAKIDEAAVVAKTLNPGEAADIDAKVQKAHSDIDTSYSTAQSNNVANTDTTVDGYTPSTEPRLTYYHATVMANADTHKQASKSYKPPNKKSVSQLDFFMNRIDSIDYDAIQTVMNIINSGDTKYITKATAKKLAEVDAKYSAKLADGTYSYSEAVSEYGTIIDSIARKLPENSLRPEARSVLKRTLALEHYSKMVNPNGAITVKQTPIIGDTVVSAKSSEMYAGDDTVLSQVANETQLAIDGSTIAPDSVVTNSAKLIRNETGLAAWVKRGYTRTFSGIVDVIRKTVPVEYQEYYMKNLWEYGYQANGNMARNVSAKAHQVDEIIRKKLDIRKGTDEERAITWLIEGKRQVGKGKNYKIIDYTEADAVAQFGTDRVNAIKQAATYMKSEYSTYLNTVNDMIKRVYPNNPERLIEPQENYVRHMVEMRSGLMAGDTMVAPSANQVDNAGKFMDMNTNEGGRMGKGNVTGHVITPKMRKESIMKHRAKDVKPYEDLAVSSFLDYVSQAEYAINMTPVIMRVRGFTRDLLKGAEGGDNVKELVQYLNQYANSMSGVPHNVDIALNNQFSSSTPANLIGRITRLRKSSAVAVKARVLTSQFPQFTAGAAEIFSRGKGINGLYDITMGSRDTIMSLFDPKMKATMRNRYKKSNVLTSKYYGMELDKIRKTSWLSKTGNVIEAMDKATTLAVWNGSYYQAKRNGLSADAAIKYADDLTISVIAGRSAVDFTPSSKSAVMEFIFPMQQDIARQASAIFSHVKKGDMKFILFLSGLNYILNEGTQAIGAGRPAPDLVEALIDGVENVEAIMTEDAIYNEEVADGKEGKPRTGFDTASKATIAFLGRQAGEVLSNVPAGNLPAQFLLNDRDRAFLFGEADPARFGIGFTEGSNISTTLKDPLKTAKDYIPAGGAIYNIGKTGYNYLFPKEGVVGVYDEDDKMRFPLRTNPASIAQSALFGEYSSPEAQRSFDEKIYALGKEDTRKVQNAIKGGISPQLAYEVITEFRKLRKPMDKIEYIEGLSVSEEEKSLIFQYLYHGYGVKK